MSFTKQTHNILIVALTFFNIAILQSSERLNQDLMIAALNGQLEQVKYLITQGAHVNAESSSGLTSLMIAACKGHAKIVEHLIGQGANVNAKTDGNITALVFAALQGHPNVTRYLIEHGDSADTTTITELLAQLEVRQGCLIVRYVIEHRAERPTFNDVKAYFEQRQEEQGTLRAQYKSYETIRNYLDKISVIQRYLKDALVEQQITQEPDLAQYFSNHSQFNKSLSEDDVYETMRESSEEITKENRQQQKDEKRFETMTERFMVDQIAYWKGKVREAIHPLREQDTNPLRNLLTEINPGLLPQIISYFKSKEIFKSLIKDTLLPRATKPQRKRLLQILQAEERVESERYAPDAGPVLREAIAQKIKEEIARKPEKQTRTKTLEQNCCSIS